MVAETGLYVLEDRDKVEVIDATRFCSGNKGRTSLAILVTLDSGELLIHDAVTASAGEAARMMFQIRTGTPIELSEWTDITSIKDHCVIDRSRAEKVSPADLGRLDS